MTTFRLKIFLVILIVITLFCPVVSAEQFRPLPVNNELLQVFDSIKVPTQDINTRVRYLWENDKSWFTRWKMLEMGKESIDCTYFIIDNKTTIIGGRNIGSDYFAGKGEDPSVYRDSDVVMDGPCVTAQLEQAFDVEWNHLKNSNVSPDLINWKSQALRINLAYHVMNKYLQGGGVFDPAKAQDKATRELLKEFNAEITLYKNLTSYASFNIWQGEREKPVKIIDKTAKIGTFNDITPTLSRFMDACKYEIFIQSPYVVLTDEAYGALKRASDRGVKIIIHSNSGGSTDSLAPQAFLMNDWKKMLKEMVNLRLMVAPSANERLHSKCFVFDSQIAVVGTYNMDPLSQDFNSEVVAAIKDPSFGTMVRHRLYEDMNPVVEYKIQVQPDGTVKSLVGPEDHLNAELVKKMNMYRKISLLRPVI